MQKIPRASRVRLLATPIAAVTMVLAAMGTAVDADAGNLKLRPQAPQPAKEMFQRSHPHLNVQSIGAARLKPRPGPGRPTGPSGLAAEPTELADWYCGEGSGPGGYAECTDDLIASCNGTYKPPGTNGPNQTWGMCHEKS